MVKKVATDAYSASKRWLRLDFGLFREKFFLSEVG